MKKLKVAYIGNFKHKHCTEVHVMKTLQAAGLQVSPYQENRIDARGVYQAGKMSDFVLYTRTWGLPPEMTNVWRSLEARGIPSASYHLDLFVGLHREDTLETDPFWTTSVCFTPDGDPVSEDVFEKRGIHHHYLPPAVFQRECVRGRFRSTLANDICFVGSYPYPHPEWPYRNTLVEMLQEKYGDRFTRYGPGAQTVRNQDLNDVYASTKVVVGDSLCPDFVKPMYWSDRPYETVGRGGVLIMPRIEGLDNHFEDRKHLRFYNFCDFPTLFSLIDELIEDREQAESLRAEGMQHVRANHTYTNRLQEALNVIRQVKDKL